MGRAPAIALFGIALYVLQPGCATPVNSPGPQTGEAALGRPAPLPARAVAAFDGGAGPALAPVVGRVSLIATGDIIAHGAVKDAAAAADGGFDALLSQVAPAVQSADLAFANLETPVAPGHDHGSRSFVFNAPVSMLQAVGRAGFDVLLFANNHVYDQERDGLIESLGHLDQSGLKYLGAGKTRAQAAAPVKQEVNGVKLAWLGATQFLNNPKNVDDPAQPAVNLIDAAAMEQAIAQVRPEVDAVLVAVHWGTEYQDAPRPEDVALAHRWLEAGADVIIGSHPHVLQPVEVYRTRDGRSGLILYSLGNFLSNQSRLFLDRASADRQGDTRDGALVRFTLEKRDYGKGGTAVNLAELRYLPLWQDNTYYRPAGAPLDIRPVVIDAELARGQKELAALQALPAPDKAQKQRIVALTDRLAMLEKRRARIVSRLGDDFAGDPDPALLEKLVAAAPR